MSFETIVIILMLLVVIVTFVVMAVLLASKRASSPHHIPALAKAGDQLARWYVGLWVVNVLLFAVLVLKLVLVGKS